MKKRKRIIILQWLLVVFGFTQIAGYLTKSVALQGIGMSYCIGPLPTVFSTVDGVEGFNTRHSIIYTRTNNEPDTTIINARLFNEFEGPYFLKNAYSIFFAYPHILKPQQIEDGWQFALCKKNLLQLCKLNSKDNTASVQTSRIRNNREEILNFRSHCR